MKRLFLFMLSTLVILSSCERNNYDACVVETLPAVIIDSTHVKLNGNVSVDINISILYKGFCWSLHTNPTSNDNFSENGFDSGIFSENINIIADTTYYFRAYAMTNDGVLYGQELTFNSLDIVELPITDFFIDTIESTSAYIIGKINYTGNSDILKRGVCFSTENNPTINNNSNVVLGNNIEPFVCVLINLIPETTYFIKSFAINRLGINYSAEKTFTTKKNDIIEEVKIGNQIWMAKNLDVTKYNDGEIIKNVNDNSEWCELSSGAYCWYNNDVVSKRTYGSLYNWFAANSGKICPVGWRVPKIKDWEELFYYLGKDSVCIKIKDVGTEHWSFEAPATNETGFTALGAGHRYGTTGDFNDLRFRAYWWCEDDDWSVIQMWTFPGNDIVIRHEEGNGGYQYNKNSGYSIRCIKEED